MHGGRFSKLPATWDFPASGALHCWRHWNLGNRAEGTPPLKIMEINDVKHVDRLPLQENEKRRPARKTLCDLRFLMKFIEAKIRENGSWVDEHNYQTVTQMYTDVAEELVVRGDDLREDEGARRDGHMKWPTIVRLLCKKALLERERRRRDREYSSTYLDYM
jgi:hypothetical protein